MGNGLLWATPPASFERRGEGGVAWQYRSRPAASSRDARGPDVRLTRDSLEVAVGPLPQYPLYYYRAPDDSLLVVSSELGPLLTMFPSGAVNLRRLVGIMSWRPDPDPGATTFVHLRRVRACEQIVAGAAGVQVSMQVPRAGPSFRRARANDLACELKERLEDAVTRAIDESRRVAVYVGGGLDSSGVLALALARCRGAGQAELEAIAEVWASPGDDRPHLATLERELGIVAVRLPARDGAPWFARSLCTDVQPQAFGGACLDMLLWSTGLARGADVALSGYAGDEVCGGGVSFAPLVLQGRAIHAVASALRLQMPWRVTPARRIASWVVSPLVRGWIPRGMVVKGLRHRQRQPWMTPRFLDLLEPLLGRVRTRIARTPDERMADFCESPYLSELSMYWGQLASVTGAAPADVFRDLEFVRFIAQVDPVVLSHGNQYRGLYLLAMNGVIPESIRQRRDKALGQPGVAEAAIAADARDYLSSLSSLEHLASLGLVDPEAFRGTFEAWLSAMMRGERLVDDPTDESWHQVWHLLSSEAFVRGIAAGGAPRSGTSASR